LRVDVPNHREIPEKRIIDVQREVVDLNAFAVFKDREEQVRQAVLEAGYMDEGGVISGKFYEDRGKFRLSINLSPKEWEEVNLLRIFRRADSWHARLAGVFLGTEGYIYSRVNERTHWNKISKKIYPVPLPIPRYVVVEVVQGEFPPFALQWKEGEYLYHNEGQLSQLPDKFVSGVTGRHFFDTPRAAQSRGIIEQEGTFPSFALLFAPGWIKANSILRMYFAETK